MYWLTFYKKKFMNNEMEIYSFKLIFRDKAKP